MVGVLTPAPRSARATRPRRAGRRARCLVRGGRPAGAGRAAELPDLGADRGGGRLGGRVDPHAGVIGQALAGDVEHERPQAQVLVLGARDRTGRATGRWPPGRGWCGGAGRASRSRDGRRRRAGRGPRRAGRGTSRTSTIAPSPSRSACPRVMRARPPRSRAPPPLRSPAGASPVDRAVAELRPLEEGREAVHAGHLLVAVEGDAAEVFHRRLVDAAGDAVPGQAPLHRGVGGDHGTARVALAPKRVQIGVCGLLHLGRQHERSELATAGARAHDEHGGRGGEGDPDEHGDLPVGARDGAVRRRAVEPRRGAVCIRRAAEEVGQVQEPDRVAARPQPIGEQDQGDGREDRGLDARDPPPPLQLGVELAAAVDLGVHEERRADDRQDRRQHERGHDEDVVAGCGRRGRPRRGGRVAVAAPGRDGRHGEQPHHRDRREGCARRRARDAVEEWRPHLAGWDATSCHPVRLARPWPSTTCASGSTFCAGRASSSRSRRRSIRTSRSPRSPTA